MSNRVEVSRGPELESSHRFDAVLVGLRPGEELRFGDPARPAFWRSAMKPFQALPLVGDGVAAAAGFGSEELALACASHAGSALHVSGVAAMLERLGVDREALACGPHAPLSGSAARELYRSGGNLDRLHNSCSGKHAGMLALARHHGWSLEGYHHREHPVQHRIRRELERWLDVSPEGLAWAVDGCGVPTPYLTLRQMARAYARLGVAAAAGESGPREIVGAMTGHPEHVSGPGRPTTRIMRETGGRWLVKEGAEGVYCAASPREGWGVALKVADGAGRASVPALLEVLRVAGCLAAEEAERLDDLRRSVVRNTRGEEVGAIRARVEMRPAAAPGGA